MHLAFPGSDSWIPSVSGNGRGSTDGATLFTIICYFPSLLLRNCPSPHFTQCQRNLGTPGRVADVERLLHQLLLCYLFSLHLKHTQPSLLTNHCIQFKSLENTLVTSSSAPKGLSLIWKCTR